MYLLAYLKGMGLGGSLIMAIGAQNAFVLGQAIRKNHAVPTSLTCASLDAVLIFAGVFGLGALIKSSPLFLDIATFGGVAFLAVYGFLAFRRAFQPGHLSASDDGVIRTVRAAIATTLALSLLNPHVYLDTVVLLGSIGGQLPQSQAIIFALGATTASFLWFMSLAFGGRLLAPWLSQDKHWKRLDMFIGATMWTIGGSLLYSRFAA